MSERPVKTSFSGCRAARALRCGKRDQRLQVPSAQKVAANFKKAMERIARGQSRAKRNPGKAEPRSVLFDGPVGPRGRCE